MKELREYAKIAAKQLAVQLDIELSSNTIWHGANAFTDNPWPTLIADWGVIDILPAQEKGHLLIQGFSNETACVHEILVDCTDESIAIVNVIGQLFTFAITVRNDK